MTARVRRLLQRNSQAKESITVGGAALNLVFGRIEFQGKSLELSKKELQIIYYLFLNRGRTVLKDELVEYLWENKWYVDQNILNVNLSRLRKRLGEIGTGGFSFIRYRNKGTGQGGAGMNFWCYLEEKLFVMMGNLFLMVLAGVYLRACGNPGAVIFYFIGIWLLILAGNLVWGYERQRRKYREMCSLFAGLEESI